MPHAYFVTFDFYMKAWILNDIFIMSHSQVICQWDEYSIYYKLLWKINLEFDINAGPQATISRP